MRRRRAVHTPPKGGRRLTEIFCGVTDCIHNGHERCQKANIRILATVDHPTTTDRVNCMSFTARSEVAKAQPALVQGVDVDPALRGGTSATAAESPGGVHGGGRLPFQDAGVRSLRAAAAAHPHEELGVALRAQDGRCPKP